MVRLSSYDGILNLVDNSGDKFNTSEMSWTMTLIGRIWTGVVRGSVCLRLSIELTVVKFCSNLREFKLGKFKFLTLR